MAIFTTKTERDKKIQLKLNNQLFLVPLSNCKSSQVTHMCLLNVMGKMPNFGVETMEPGSKMIH